MPTELVNADFAQRAVIATNELRWVPSPQAGVERRMLDRVGGEVARATSIVRYAPASVFAEHDHALGEEFLVLEGVFADEHGNYPTGTYVRNPPGSHHSPRTDSGCTIFVKLRQMTPTENRRIVVDTTKLEWIPGEVDGHWLRDLHSSGQEGERVTMERLDAVVALPEIECRGGEEVLLLSGDLCDATGTYGPCTWIRNPAGYRRVLRSKGGAVYWAKRGHLRTIP